MKRVPYGGYLDHFIMDPGLLPNQLASLEKLEVCCVKGIHLPTRILTCEYSQFRNP